MLYLVFLPMLFLIVVVFAISATLHKQKAARANQTNPEQTFSRGPQAQPNAPVRPTVQANVKPKQKSDLTPRLRTEPAQTPAKPAQKPAVKEPLKAQAPTLTFTGNDDVRGILYAEILGKPKALRRS